FPCWRAGLRKKKVLTRRATTRPSALRNALAGPAPGSSLTIVSGGTFRCECKALVLAVAVSVTSRRALRCSCDLRRLGSRRRARRPRRGPAWREQQAISHGVV